MTNVNEPNRYAGRKVVVIGGTHGIGRAVVESLLAEGAEVLLTGGDKRRVDAAQRELGPSAHLVRSDVSNLGDIDALGDTVASTLGELDLVHLNAAVAELEPVASVTEASFDRVFDVNTKGAFFTLQRLTPLVRDGGAIVMTTSVADGSGTPGMSVYAASKAALRSFASSLAAELLPRGIRVNAVSPGFIDTPTMGAAGLSDEQRALFRHLGDDITPMKRHGTAAEVARAVLFLAFDATFTTGTLLPVDGSLGQNLTPPAA